jgi:hypothetical protein
VDRCTSSDWNQGGRVAPPPCRTIRQAFTDWLPEQERTLEPPPHQPLHLPFLLPLRLPQHQLLRLL